MIYKLLEIIEKTEKNINKHPDLIESGEKTTVTSFKSSKELVEKPKKNYQKPIIFDNENLDRFNTNDNHDIDLKLLRKNLFSREKHRPIFQRAATSHQLYRFHPQKNDFIYKFNNELNEQKMTTTLRNNNKRVSALNSNESHGFNNFVGDSNFYFGNTKEKINPKYNDSHLKFLI